MPTRRRQATWGAPAGCRALMIAACGSSSKKAPAPPTTAPAGTPSRNGGAIFGASTYRFSAGSHFGMTGDLRPNVCKVTPFGEGKYQIPCVAR